MKTKAYKVAAVSSNTNSFGLRQYVMMPRTGNAWKVCRSEINAWTRGQRIMVPMENGEPNWTILNCELPEKIDLLPPKEVVKEVFA